MHSRIASSSILTRNRSFRHVPLISSSPSCHFVRNSRSISNGNKQYISTESTSPPTAPHSTPMISNYANYNKNNSNKCNNINSSKLINSFSTLTVNQHDNTADGVDIAVTNNPTVTNGNGNGVGICDNNKNKMNDKNMEVIHLVQSLQNIVNAQQSLGMYYDSLIQETLSVSPLSPQIPQSTSITSTTSVTSTSVTSTTSIPTPTPLSPPTKEGTNKQPRNNKPSEMTKKAKKWHQEMNKAINNKQPRIALNLFNNMPPTSHFLYLAKHSNKYNKTKNKGPNMVNISFLFRTLRKLISLLTPDKINVAFEVFLKSEDMYYLFEQELEDHQDDVDVDDDMDVEVEVEVDDHRSQESNRQLQKMREMILFRIISAIGNAANEQYYAPSQKPSSSSSSSSHFRDTKKSKSSSSLSLSRMDYTKMIHKLTSIIQYDLHDNPLLQHVLYPKLIKSVLRQNFCHTTYFKETERDLWDAAISSYDDLGDIHLLMTTNENHQEGDNYEEEVVDNDISAANDESLYEDGNGNDDDNQNQNMKAQSEIGEEERKKWKEVMNGYEELLRLSTFRKQQDLPFVDILNVVVSNGGTPKAENVLNILQNEYPYGNNRNVRTLLKSIIQLQQNKDPSQLDYLIGPQTLERMTCSSARKGHSKVIMLVWEYMNLIQTSLQQQNNSPSWLYNRPTEGLYENAATSFAASGRQDQLVFGILTEMEKEGFKPSRSFLNRLAATLRTRSSVRRLDNAMHIIRNSYNNNNNNYNNNNEEEGGDMVLKPTTSGLNIVLAGFADLGYSIKAMDIYSEFEGLECIPDENTYSFLMDSIAMNVSTAIPPNTGGIVIGNDDNDNDNMISWLDSQLEAADAILSAAIEMGHDSDKHLIHAYVRILCVVGQLDKALYFLEDRLENRARVNQSTLGLLALSNAKVGNMDAVDEILSMCRQAGYKNALPSYVTEKIKMIRNQA